MILSYKNISPKIPESVFVASNATVIGDVEFSEDSSVWFNTVIRGDVHRIRIGARTNIQDGCVLHVTYQKYSLTLGNEVTVGHGAILHGCVIEDQCLIGMGARVLDGARIGKFSLVAAGSLVREGQEIPPQTLVAGVPAVPKRTLSEQEVQTILQSAKRYVEYKNTYLESVL